MSYVIVELSAVKTLSRQYPSASRQMLPTPLVETRSIVCVETPTIAEPQQSTLWYSRSHLFGGFCRGLEPIADQRRNETNKQHQTIKK